MQQSIKSDCENIESSVLCKMYLFSLVIYMGYVMLKSNVRAEFCLCIIKHDAMKMYGAVEV
jgi:hypothetical protein